MLPGPNTHTINTSSTGKDIAAIRTAASPYFDAEIDGFDVVMEAVGIPATFDMCQKLVGKGGTIANIGVHSAPVSLEIDRLWPRGTSKLCRSGVESIGLRSRNMLTFDLSICNSALNGASKHAHDPSYPRPVICRKARDGCLDGNTW